MQGKSRSGSFMIGYVMKKNNCTYEEALTFVKSKREMVLPNPGFAEQLKQYQEKHVK